MMYMIKDNKNIKSYNNANAYSTNGVATLTAFPTCLNLTRKLSLEASILHDYSSIYYSISYFWLLQMN